MNFITGQIDGKELTPDGISSSCAEGWKAWIKARDARQNWLVARPDVQNKITEAILDNKRIIFLVGSGGCGKTEALLEMTAQKVDQFALASEFPGFVVVESCSEVRVDWLETSIGKWANRGVAPYQTIDQPIARLATANPSLKLLISIGLDGLDEDFPSREALTALMKATRERKDILLILTVRGNEYKHVSRFIYPYYPIPPITNTDSNIAVVPVDEFEYNEVLKSVLRKSKIMYF